MTTIVLCEMTIQSLFNMSKIPYDPNQSFEDKITILKNANLLQKEQNYSNNTELSKNDETSVNTKSTNNTHCGIEDLADFFTDKSESVDFIKQMYLMPVDKKNPEGAYYEDLHMKIILKRDFNTKKLIRICENLVDKDGKLTLACHYDYNGKYIAFDTNGGSANGEWYCSKTSGSIVVITESEGLSDYHGKYTYFNTQTTKTKDRKMYSECRVKFSRNDPYVFDGFSRSVPISPNPTPSHKLPQMKEGKWQYTTTYYYIDDLKNLVGPNSFEADLLIERLQADFYKVTVTNTDYKVILNVVKMDYNIFIHGDSLIDDRKYELVPTEIKNGVILEVEGYDNSLEGIMLADGGIKARSFSKIYAKYIKD